MKLANEQIFGRFAWKFFESYYLLIAMPPKLFFSFYFSVFSDHSSLTLIIFVPLPMPKKVIHIIILSFSVHLIFLLFGFFLEFLINVVAFEMECVDSVHSLLGPMN